MRSPPPGRARQSAPIPPGANRTTKTDREAVHIRLEGLDDLRGVTRDAGDECVEILQQRQQDGGDTGPAKDPEPPTTAIARNATEAVTVNTLGETKPTTEA